VTIAMGFMIGDAVILCADSQEVISDYAKTTTQKIRNTTFYNNWRLGIAGSADDSTYLDAYYSELQMKLSKVQQFDYVQITKIIKEELISFYKKHIWAAPKDERQSS
jgi:hypothetical protein